MATKNKNKKYEVCKTHLPVRCTNQTSVLFQALVALLIKLRRANSVLTRGSCSWPLSVARVRWLDISDRYRSFAFKISGASVAVSRRRITETSCFSMTSSTRPHPNSKSTGVTCSLRLRPVTMRAPKLIAFCTRFFCSAVQLPHTLTQYRTCGRTSASTSIRFVSSGSLWRILAKPTNTA